MRFRVYQDLRGEWRWRLVAENGRVMADSAEGYDEERGASKALATIVGAVATGEYTITTQDG